MVETPQPAEPAGAPDAGSPRRQRLSRLLAAGVAVAAVFAVCATVAAVAFTHQHRRDQAGVTAARSALNVQQSNTSAAAARLSSTTDAASTFDPAAKNLAGLAQQLTSDVDGELTASDVLLTAGVSGDDSGWNATMSRIQTLVQQETDTANQFETTASTVPSS